VAGPTRAPIATRQRREEIHGTTQRPTVYRVHVQTQGETSHDSIELGDLERIEQRPRGERVRDVPTLRSVRGRGDQRGRKPRPLDRGVAGDGIGDALIGATCDQSNTQGQFRYPYGPHDRHRLIAGRESRPASSLRTICGLLGVASPFP
jgi:hypothetical protein